jgi:DNA-binding XRE family transcriptional regulator
MNGMERSKRKKLAKAGWRVGTPAEFLGLSKAEEALVDMKAMLGSRLRKTREQHRLTQTDLAKRIGSSQSRVAKMEAGDPGVSLDLLVQGLLAAGATHREIASALVPRKKAASA